MAKKKHKKDPGKKQKASSSDVSDRSSTLPNSPAASSAMRHAACRQAWLWGPSSSAIGPLTGEPPQAPRSSHEATQPAASEPGPSTPPPAKRSKPAAEPTKGKGKDKAAKAKPAPQPGRWVDRDCNAALNMQRIGESRWRPLELCWWPDQGALPAKGKEYPGLGYKRVRDKPPKAQEQQQQPAEAQWLRPVKSMAKRSQVRYLMCSTSINNITRFYDRDVSAALNIRRCAVGPGPRPTELCYWTNRPAMPKPGEPGQEWVEIPDKPLLRKWQRQLQQ
ncbi:hypothetical protein QJQ45_003478 [Haematococcus lacustris]|nr:hypothetical protein QJQ45_003478 [Haematococcus lacustris]